MRKYRRKIILPKNMNFDKFEKEFLRGEFYKKVQWGERNKIYEFDLTGVQWFDLMELMSLAICSDYILKKTGCESEFNFFRSQQAGGNETVMRLQKVVRFVKAMAFPDLLLSKNIGLNIKPSDATDKTGFLSIRRLNFDEFAFILEKIREVFKFNYAGLITEVQTYSFINRLVFEACENIFEHAYDKGQPNTQRSELIAIRRYPAATDPISMKMRAHSASWIRKLQEWYPKQETLEVVIADGGVGIYNRLGETFKKARTEEIREKLDREPIATELSELECIKWALSPRQTTSSNLQFTKMKKGYGLFVVKMYCVEGWGGCFYIRSGKSRAVYMGDINDPVVPNDGDLEFFPGVQIRLFLPIIDREEEIQKIKDLDDKLGR